MKSKAMLITLQNALCGADSRRRICSPNGALLLCRSMLWDVYHNDPGPLKIADRRGSPVTVSDMEELCALAAAEKLEGSK